MRVKFRARLRAAAALSFVLAAVTAASWGAAAAPAGATVSNYCNNQTLTAAQWCEGAIRTMYAVEGWGDQHSVCVFFQASIEFGTRCSGGPGEHVYSGFEVPVKAKPGIDNCACSPNTVHGRAYQP